MKRLITVLLFCAAALALPAYGQDEQARDLFTSYTNSNAAQGQPGAKLRIELLRGSNRQFVPLDTTFHAGDKVKLHFQVNFASYVTIYNLGTSGRVSRLYPKESRYATVRAGSNYIVPATADEWFEFDDTPGAERLNFVFSSRVPQSKPARPTASRPAAPPTDIVTVNPGGRQMVVEDSDEASEEALTNGRDLKPVQLKDAYYVIGKAPQLRQRVGILISLRHQ